MATGSPEDIANTVETLPQEDVNGNTLPESLEADKASSTSNVTVTKKPVKKAKTTIRSAIKDRLSSNTKEGDSSTNKQDKNKGLVIDIPASIVDLDLIDDVTDIKYAVSSIYHHKVVADIVVDLIRINSERSDDTDIYDRVSGAVKGNYGQRALKDILSSIRDKTGSVAKIIGSLVNRMTDRVQMRPNIFVSKLLINSGFMAVDIAKNAYYFTEKTHAINRIATLKAMMILLIIRIMKKDIYCLTIYNQELANQLSVVTKVAAVDKDPQTAHELAVISNKLSYNKSQLADRIRQISMFKVQLDLCLNDHPEAVQHIVDMTTKSSLSEDIIDSIKERLGTIIQAPMTYLQMSPLKFQLDELLGFDFNNSDEMWSLRARHCLDHVIACFSHINEVGDVILECGSSQVTEYPLHHIGMPQVYTKGQVDNMCRAGVLLTTLSITSSLVTTYLSVVCDNMKTAATLHKMVISKVLTLISAMQDLKHNIDMLKFNNSQVMRTGNLVHVGLAHETLFNSIVQDYYDATRRMYESMCVILRAAFSLLAIYDPATAYHFGDVIENNGDIFDII